MDPNLDEAASAAANDPSSLFDALPDSAFDVDFDDDAGTPEPDAGTAAVVPAGADPVDADESGGLAPAGDVEIEGEAQPEPEPEPEATPPAAEPEAIAIDGKAVPIAEVRQGYLRQADYEQRVTELAGHHQALEGRAAALVENEGKLNDVLEVAMALVQSKLPQPPDPALIETDIVGFTRQKAAYETAMKEVQTLIDARQKVRERGETDKAEKARAENGRQAEALEAGRRELFTRMPELKTPEGRQAFMGAVAKHGSHYGLSPEVINGIQDPRAFAVIRDAMAYREQQAKKPAVVAKAQAAPPLRQAARPAAGARDAASLQAARQRLQREGTLEAAAALLPDELFE